MESKKFRIVFRRGSLALKLAVLAVVVLSIAALLLVWLYKQDAFVSKPWSTSRKTAACARPWTNWAPSAESPISERNSWVWLTQIPLLLNLRIEEQTHLWS